MMRKHVAIALTSLVLLTSVGCATYRDDLDRGTNHFRNHDYEKAVVLFDVLERDLDSLSPQERAQYCYYRGMSHHLLEQRRHARHWLGRAAAREASYEGALSPDEARKTKEVLDVLNRDRWGGASTPSASLTCSSDNDCSTGQFCDDRKCKDTPATGDDGTPAATKGPDGGCSADSDCPGTKLCESGICKAP